MFRRKTAMFSKQEETHSSTNTQSTRTNLSLFCKLKNSTTKSRRVSQRNKKGLPRPVDFRTSVWLLLSSAIERKDCLVSLVVAQPNSSAFDFARSKCSTRPNSGREQTGQALNGCVRKRTEQLAS